MVVHLTTNASLMNGPETFQRAVYLIHSPGQLLPLIEWGLIFLPLIFHAVTGCLDRQIGAIQQSSVPLYQQPSLHLSALDGNHRPGLFVFSHFASARMGSF